MPPVNTGDKIIIPSYDTRIIKFYVSLSLLTTTITYNMIIRKKLKTVFTSDNAVVFKTGCILFAKLLSSIAYNTMEWTVGQLSLSVVSGTAAERR